MNSCTICFTTGERYGILLNLKIRKIIVGIFPPKICNLPGNYDLSSHDFGPFTWNVLFAHQEAIDRIQVGSCRLGLWRILDVERDAICSVNTFPAPGLIQSGRIPSWELCVKSSSAQHLCLRMFSPWSRGHFPSPHKLGLVIKRGAHQCEHKWTCADSQLFSSD